jgi:hypothetical protein
MKQPKPMTQVGPDDPPPQEEPTQDVPVYPEQDTPPGTESAIRVAAGPGGNDEPKEGEDDVDEDDLDPQAPHSPPDVGRRRVIFDGSGLAC